jgi:zinc transporter
MVSIRMWLEPRRVITLRHRRAMAVDDVRASLTTGRGPTTTGDLLVELSRCLLERMAGVIDDLDDHVDALENEVLTSESGELRPRLADLRRQAISLRRHLAPQRDVMARLQNERASWLTDIDRIHLRELADRTTRYVEDLDAARERAAVTQEELNTRIAEHTNKTMYLLSIVAAIFLPLGLVTGLLGINVGGIPGTDNPWAFAIVCAMLVATALIMVWGFRRKHWL